MRENLLMLNVSWFMNVSHHIYDNHISDCNICTTYSSASYYAVRKSMIKMHVNYELLDECKRGTKLHLCAIGGVILLTLASSFPQCTNDMDYSIYRLLADTNYHQ